MVLLILFEDVVRAVVVKRSVSNNNNRFRTNATGNKQYNYNSNKRRYDVCSFSLSVLGFIYLFIDTRKNSHPLTSVGALKMAESEEEVNVLVQRVVKDITNAFKRNPNM